MMHEISAARRRTGGMRIVILGGLLAVAALSRPARGASADIQGLITAINYGAQTLEVNGEFVAADGSTQIENDLGGAIAFSDLQFGMNVRARGDTQPGGEILATRIDVKEPGSGNNDGGTLEFLGLVDSIDSGAKTMTVNGLVVQTTDYTYFETIQQTPTTFGAFNANQVVKVRGTPLVDGRVLAGGIEMEDDLPGDHLEFNLKFKGTITAIDAGEMSMTIAGRIVSTSAATHFEDANGADATFAAFSAGQFVEIKARTQDGGGILAVEIEAKAAADGDAGKAEFKGLIESVNAGAMSLTVDGQTVLTNGSSTIVDAFNAPAAFGDLAAGKLVEVHGSAQAGGEVLADSIKIEDNPRGVAEQEFEVRMRGAIESVDSGASTLTILGTIIRTTGSTVFLDNLNAPIAFGSFAAGEYAEAQGRRLGDGTIEAARIKKEDGPPPAGGDDTLVNAMLLSVNAGAGTVNAEGTTAAKTSGTTFANRFGTPILFSDLAIGNFTQIAGNTQSPGAMTSSRTAQQDQFFVYIKSPAAATPTPTPGASPTPSISPTPTLTPSPSPTPFNNGALLDNSIPATVYQGSTLWVGLTMQNTGNTTWVADGGSPYSVATTNDACGLLPARLTLVTGPAVGPGEFGQFVGELTAPGTTQSCSADLQLVQEFVQYFGPVVHVTVNVIERPNASEDWELFE